MQLPQRLERLLLDHTIHIYIEMTGTLHVNKVAVTTVTSCVQANNEEVSAKYACWQCFLVSGLCTSPLSSRVVTAALLLGSWSFNSFVLETNSVL